MGEDYTHADAWRAAGLCRKEYREPLKNRDSAAIEKLDTLWFSQKRGRPSIQNRAISLCGRCPVKQLCFEEGVVHGDFGIWGGVTAGTLRRIRKTETGSLLLKKAFEEGWLNHFGPAADLRKEWKQKYATAEQLAGEPEYAESPVTADELQGLLTQPIPEFVLPTGA